MKTHTTRRYTLLLVLVLLLAGCATQSQPAGEATTGPTAADATTLVVAVSGDYESFDPCIGGSPRTTEIVASVYDTPVTFKVEQHEGYQKQVLDDETGWVPHLAEAVEVSDDNRVITFTLREDVQFYPSGNQMTAEDWYWSWERQLSEPPIGFCAFENAEAGIEEIDSIEIVDDYTIRITLDHPNALALAYMRLVDFAILDSEVVQQHTTPDDPWASEWLAKNSAGSGPYSIAGHTPGSELVLERNPLYWGETPYFERVILRVVPSVATRVALVRSGDVDIAQNIPAREAASLEDAPGINVLSIPVGNRVTLAMDLEAEPWQDNLALRQAVAYAVPYDEIIEKAFFGQARRYRSYVLEGVPGYSGAGFDYETDPEQARALLAEAGYADDGLDVTLTINTAFPEYETAAVLIQDALGEIGINVEIERLQPGVFVERWFAKELNFFIYDGIAWLDDPSTIVALWMVSDSFANYTHFSDPQVDAIQEEWRYQPDSPQRREAYAEAQRLYNEQLSVIYLALPDFLLVTRDDIAGYTLYKDTNTHYQDLWREE